MPILPFSVETVREEMLQDAVKYTKPGIYVQCFVFTILKGIYYDTSLTEMKTFHISAVLHRFFMVITEM